ncbi:TPA: Trm112 family protein [Candidatus Woesearchaeota archaeon]|nr:Trm112 family protein [Candidatus Woesearchaeota archaeon]
MSQLLSEELLSILACPVCKADLQYNKDNTGLLCTKCGAKYPITEGIPVLLPPEMR